MSITFKLVDPEAEPGSYMSTEEPGIYVGLTPDKLQRSLEFLQDADEKVIDEASVKVVIDYPLAEAHVFDLQAPNGEYFTRASLASAIAAQYQEIYAAESQTTTVREESIGEYNTRLDLDGPRGLMNRVRTDGTYGIWGHVLGDLDLHTVTWDEGQEVWYLGIDS
jgi:hypothetical protein